ncbi:hypothetical protein HNQ57_001363 [Zhongshania antarctica]|uniref:Uncharacterized protein n=1 Tax=Zhongshania antarctica TaxID=641702 RepID=A0A840R3T5_9GAMM|nr:hypothetical protein [Zhongshania antarctica]MBB5187100.1 hypothetical protein [Zhongshania antarctica]
MVFIKIELSEDVVWTELLPDGTYAKTTEGEIYLSSNHIPYLVVENKSLSICVVATGMGANNKTTDHFDLSFSHTGMGEYQRIKRDLLGGQ